MKLDTLRLANMERTNTLHDPSEANKRILACAGKIMNAQPYSRLPKILDEIIKMADDKSLADGLEREEVLCDWDGLDDSFGVLKDITGIDREEARYMLITGNFIPLEHRARILAVAEMIVEGEAYLTLMGVDSIAEVKRAFNNQQEAIGSPVRIGDEVDIPDNSFVVKRDTDDLDELKLSISLDPKSWSNIGELIEVRRSENCILGITDRDNCCVKVFRDGRSLFARLLDPTVGQNKLGKVTLNRVLLHLSDEIPEINPDNIRLNKFFKTKDAYESIGMIGTRYHMIVQDSPGNYSWKLELETYPVGRWNKAISFELVSGKLENFETALSNAKGALEFFSDQTMESWGDI
jgi:hypothetical protein